MCCGGFIHNLLKLGFQWSHEPYPLLWCRKLKNSASRGSRLSYFSHIDVGSTHVTDSSIKNGMYFMYLLTQSASFAVHSSIIPPPNYTYPLKPPPQHTTQGGRPDGQTPIIIYTSGYPWPSGTVKSPGFFRPYLFSLNRKRASPGQDGSGERASPPKGPPLPLRSLV